MVASPAMVDEQTPPPTAERGPLERDRRFWVAFAACSLGALLLLWTPKYLPLTDLPQHAAQIAIWKHLADPAYGFRDVFEVQYFTPYLFANALARLFAEVGSVLVALKLALTLAVLGLPLSLLYLLEVTRGDRWWALAGFPLSFGYAFLWGFFSYVLAVPLGVAYWAFVVDPRAEPGLRRALALTAFTTLLLATHLLIFGLCGLGAAALIGFSAKDLKTALVRLVPLGVALLLALVWASGFRTPDARSGDHYRYGLQRLVELPALLLGYPEDVPSLLGGALLMILFLASGVRLAKQRARWLPLVIWAALYLAVPRDFDNVAFLYPRLACMLVPAAILATEPGASRVRPALVHGALVAIALGWMALVWTSFWAFDQDARQFDVVMRAMPPKQRIRSLIFERGSDYTPGGVPFLHFPVWYQVNKGGTTSFSFATSSLSVVVFRPERRRVVPAAIDWVPGNFDMAREQEDYDYFVVRAPVDLGRELFRNATRRITPEAHGGLWWLSRRGDPLESNGSEHP